MAESKRVIWDFDKETATITVSNDSTLADNEKHFSFKLIKYKDADTHEESLEIKSLRDGKDNGSIVTTMFDLESDIKNLMRYGVVLSAIDFRTLRKTIEDNYLNLSDTPVSLGNDDRLNNLIEQVKDYVTGFKELITVDFCNIPVKLFNEIAEDCGYSNYEMKALRAMLAKGKYIHVQSGRYAILTRIKDKPERVIAFYRKKLGVELPEKEQKQTKKGDKNE